MKSFGILVLGFSLMGAARTIDHPALLDVATTTPEATTPNLKRVTAADLPQTAIDDADAGDWEAGSRAGLKTALQLQLASCQNQSQTEAWDFAGKKISRRRWCVTTIQWFLAKLQTAQSLNELYLAAQNELEWYQSVGKPVTNDVEFTGYFYPVHEAKKVADAVFKYPVYQKPADLVQVTVNGQKVWRRKVGSTYVPYYTREQIVHGALAGKGLEIGYVASPVDAYLLEVQGSGALIFTDANGVQSRQFVNYGAQNGYTYVSLGKLMRAAGIAEEYINLQGIRKYFTEVHPEDWEKFSNQNPSFVFYQKATSGPYGSAGVILTPKHSVAVDNSEFPKGAVGLVQTDRPIQVVGNEATAWKTFFQFILAQDTGGAIKSPGRVDIFWGEGAYAEVAAGRTDRPGKLFFCVAPEVATPVRAQVRGGQAHLPTSR